MSQIISILTNSYHIHKEIKPTVTSMNNTINNMLVVVNWLSQVFTFEEQITCCN